MFLKLLQEEIKKYEESKKEEQNKWVGLPPWKVKLLKEKEALRKQKEEEEIRFRMKQEKEKKQWESLPSWKQTLLAMKGVTRFAKKIEESQSRVDYVASGRLINEDKHTNGQPAHTNDDDAVSDQE